MPAHVEGQHAQERVGPYPLLHPVVDRARVQSAGDLRHALPVEETRLEQPLLAQLLDVWRPQRCDPSEARRLQVGQARRDQDPVWPPTMATAMPREKPVLALLGGVPLKGYPSRAAVAWMPSRCVSCHRMLDYHALPFRGWQSMVARLA